MREDIRDSINPSGTQYGQLMRESINLQRRAEARESVLRASDRTAGGEEYRDLTRRVKDLMLRRVALLRRMEDVPTIEDAFPRIRPLTNEKRVDRDSKSILDAFMTDTLSRPAVLAVAGDADLRPDQLSESEWEAFCHARSALAERLGYGLGYDDAHAGDVQMSKWFVIRKGQLTFEMQHFAVASTPAILGRSRISFLRVTAKIADSVTEHLTFDHTLITSCTDPSVQQEIDRVVAIFA